MERAEMKLHVHLDHIVIEQDRWGLPHCVTPLPANKYTNKTAHEPLPPSLLPGRLQDSHQKVGSEEMLSTIRHGANTVFSSKDSMTTEDDIDSILARGEKRVNHTNKCTELLFIHVP